MRDDLRDRDRAVLRVLAEQTHALHAGRVWQLACPGEPYRGRRDAGMTRTLDRLERLGLVRGRYEWEGTSRYWTITDAGREILIPERMFARLRAGTRPGDIVQFDEFPGLHWRVETAKLADDLRDSKCGVVRQRCCPEFVEIDSDPWAGGYCKLPIGHDGDHSLFYADEIARDEDRTRHETRHAKTGSQR